VTRAGGEIAVPHADVWRVLAEPYHLTDWWPGIVGVQPDRRGLAPGARWTVRVRTHNILAGRSERETLVLVREVEEGERIVFHLLAPPTDLSVRIDSHGLDRTGVEIAAEGRRVRPADALRRLRDLCETQL
jgi:uncharacterized protein YndB with AHSA1/START domain